MSFLDIFKPKSADLSAASEVKPTKAQHEKAVSAATDILQSKELQIQPGESLGDWFKRALNTAIPMVKERAEKDQQQEAAQQKFNNLNTKALTNGKD